MGLFRRNRARADVVIDLRDAARKPVWGSPVPCPSCQGRGYVDHIDPFREVMYLHCTRCEAKYELPKSEFASDDATVFTS